MTISNQGTEQRRYHHGNLRQVLIDAGLELLEEGNGELTLRAAAKRAGVSHTAPYNHFHGKDGLLAEIAIQGFAALEQATEHARSNAGPDAGDQLFATGLAYIRFGARRPALYRLMFGPRKTNVASEKVEAAGLAAFEVLVRVMQYGIISREFREADPYASAFTSWALVHGMTQMVLDQTGPLEAEAGDEIEKRLRTAHSTMMDGMRRR